MEQLRNPSEQKLLEALRSLEDGKVIVKVHNGIPATMEVWEKTDSIKLDADEARTP